VLLVVTGVMDLNGSSQLSQNINFLSYLSVLAEDGSIFYNYILFVKGWRPITQATQSYSWDVTDQCLPKLTHKPNISRYVILIGTGIWVCYKIIMGPDESHMLSSVYHLIHQVIEARFKNNINY